MVLSLTCKIILLKIGFAYDPWGYRFFPSILYLFLLGSLAYKLYASRLFQLVKKQKPSLLLFATGGIISFLLGYYIWIAPNKQYFMNILMSHFSIEKASFLIEIMKITKLVLRSIIPYLMMAVLICLLFVFTSKNRLDRWLGEDKVTFVL